MSLLLLDLMKPAELDQTLVVFSVRDPVARAISGYNYLRNVIKRPDVLAFNSINDWITSDQEHAWDFRWVRYFKRHLPSYISAVRILHFAAHRFPSVMSEMASPHFLRTSSLAVESTVALRIHMLLHEMTWSCSSKRYSN
jgi:hypothetical protein